MTTKKHNEQVSAGTEPVIEFSAKAIAILSHVIPKIDIRYYLLGFHIKKAPTGNGVIISATDGHRAAVWHDKNGKTDGEHIFKATTGFIAACKSASKRDGSVVKLDGGRLAVHDTHCGEIFVQAWKNEIEAKYPDILKVIPPNDKLVPGLRGGMNPLYLKTIGDIGKAFSTGRVSSSATHYSNGEDGSGAIVTFFYAEPQFMLVTMPMRHDGYPVKNPIPKVFVKKQTGAAK